MKKNLRNILSAVLTLAVLAVLLVIPATANETLPIPTATVTNIPEEELDKDVPLSFALKFAADELTDEQYAYYKDWFADFELTLNKTAIFNADSDTADGYLAGQYDAWSENWVCVPFEDVELKADETLKIMEYAASLMGQSGLKLTYADVYSFVKEFDCGVSFSPDFLLANPDLVVTLELRMYNPADESESYAIGPTYTFRAVDLFAASVTGNSETKYFFTLAEAIAAAEDGDIVAVLKDQTLSSQIMMEKDITINGNGNELTVSSVQKPLRIAANVTVNDLTVTNTYSGGRCIETRVGGITLNLNNVTLNATNGSTQALTVGGNAGTDGDVIVNLNGCHLDSGSIGYGIITFNPVKLTIENSTAVCGYGALYMKGAVSSLGSAGSVVNVKSSFLTSNGRDDGYAFGTVIFEENNITLNVDEKSKIIATNPENSSGRQYAFLFRDSDNDFVPTVYTGITVNVAGLIDADYPICNLISLENTVYIPAEYKDAVEASRYLTTSAGNGLIRVWATHTHDLEKTDAVDGSCTADGNEEYYTCNICKKVFADENAEKEINPDSTFIPASGHSAKLVEAKPATCTKDGWEEHYLCGCGYVAVKLEDGKIQEVTLQDVTIPAGHNYTSHVYAEESTCTKEGCVEYWACNDCQVVEIVTENGRVESTQDKTRLPLKSHTIVKVEAKAATYSQPGNIQHYKCSACGHLFANAEGTEDAENVVIPQLIQVEDNKAQVSTDAVDNALADALEKAESSGKPADVVIQVPAAPAAGESQETQEIVEVELPVSSLEDIAEEDAALTVVMPNATITVDTDALKTLADQAADSTVTLIVEEIKETTLTDKQQASIEKYDVAVTIKAEFICQETQKNIWTEESNAQAASGSVTVKMPFTPSAGTKGSDYKVLYVADDGTVEVIESTYTDGCLVFVLEHFSEYVVVNTATAGNVPDTSDKAMLMPMFLLMILSSSCLTLLIVGKKQLL